MNVNEADKLGFFPLHYAVDREKDLTSSTNNNYSALNGQEKIIQLLLEAKANVECKNLEGITPLFLGTWGNNYKVVKLLLENSANVTAPIKSKLLTPLHLAVKNNNIELLKLFLGEKKVSKNKLNIHVKDLSGYTPLHYSVSHEENLSNDFLNTKIEIIKLLIKNGASVSVQTNLGHTCFHLAVTAGHKELLLIILENKNLSYNEDQGKLSINIKDNFGVSPLHLAASKNNIEMVKILINSNADVNVTNNNGASPLHYTALNGHLEIVKLLVAHNADYNQANNKGETPLYVAKEKNYEDIAVFLQKSLRIDFNKKISIFIEAIEAIALELSGDVMPLDEVESLGDITHG